MWNPRQIAATTARWATAFAGATAERVRRVANAARTFRTFVLRKYVAFEHGLCYGAVDVLEVVLALRQILYVLASPVLMTAAAVYFGRWWIWILALAAWILVAAGIIGTREHMETHPDAGVLSERVRDLLARGFKFAIRLLVILVSVVLALRVVVPSVASEFTELRRRAVQRLGASPESRSPSAPPGSAGTPERQRAALPTPIVPLGERDALEVTPAKMPATEPEGASISRPASREAQYTSTRSSVVPTIPRPSVVPTATAADAAHLNLPGEAKPHLDGVVIRIVWSPSRLLEARRLESILRSLGATVSFVAAWDAGPSRVPGIYAAPEQQGDAAEIARAATPLFALQVCRVENTNGVIEVVPKRMRTR